MTVERRELNKQTSLFYGAICLGMAVLLSLTFSLSVGTAYGRYCKTITGTQGYFTGLKDRVWVMGQRNANQIGSALPVSWTQVSTTPYTRAVSLCISNSDERGDQRAIHDQKIRMRLYLPDEVYHSALQITLQINGDNRVYTATQEYLSPSSAAAKEIGASGWIYTFFDESGNELICQLKGGRISDLNVLITATEINSDLQNYRLLVDIIHEDTSLVSNVQEVNQ